MIRENDALGWTEYLAVALSLAASVVLGFRHCTNKSKDYFGSSVPFMAIICSLVASSTSGVSLVGKPAEIYEHGTGFYVIHTFASIVVTIVSNEIFLPVLYELECPSLYEYFQLRFNRKLKILVTVVFTLTKISYTSVMLLSPALVLNKRIEINTGIMSLGFITIFYTMLGGFKGVLWTDTIQGAVMIIATGILGSVSIYKIGGFGRLVEISYENERLSLPKLTLDPTERIPLWSYGFFLYGLTSVIINQPTFQRLRLTNSLEEAKLATWFQACGMMFFSTFSALIGLSVYAYYDGCDPKSSGLVDSYPNLIIYWVNEIGRSVSGFRGIYLACIVCASISTISVNAYSLAGLLIVEYSRPSGEWNVSCQRAMTVAVGLAIIFLAMLMKNTKSLVELSHISMSTDGIIAGLFILGTLSIQANSKGALSGGLITLVLLVLSSVARLIHPFETPKKINKFMRTDQCPFNVTLREISQIQVSADNAYVLLRISPFVTGVFAVILTVLIGVVVSVLCPDDKANVSPSLYSHVVRKFLPRRAEYEQVQRRVVHDAPSS